MSGAIVSKQRVISLLPSATEILCSIGGQHLLVGRSHEDNYPASITTLPILTGQIISKEWTDAMTIDKIVSESIKSGKSLYIVNQTLLERLQPDFILTQHLCNVCAIDLETVECIANRMSPKPEIISLNPQSLQEVLEDMKRLGVILNLEKIAKHSTDNLEFRIKKVTDFVALNAKTAAVQYKPKNVAFIEWSDPLYVGGHWTPQLICMAGGIHPLNPSGEGAPGLYVQTGGAGKSFPVTSDAVIVSDPDIFIVCPCGLSLKEARREADRIIQPTDSSSSSTWFQSLSLLKRQQHPAVYVVDGDAMFNRPGPRLVDALEWLLRVIHDIDLDSYLNYMKTSTDLSSGSELAIESIKDTQAAGKCFPYESYFKDNVNTATSAATVISATNESAFGAVAVTCSLNSDGDLINRDDMTKCDLDIEDLHMKACQKGHATYIDPGSGYTVFTAVTHLKRGKCCGNKCRHCPFGHFNVKPSLRSLTESAIRRPTLLRATNGSISIKDDRKDIYVVFWSGGKDSLLSLLAIEDELRRQYTALSSDNNNSSSSSSVVPRLVLLTHFDEEDMHIAHQNLSVHDIMDQAKALSIDLFLLPIPRLTGNSEYCERVKQGLCYLYEQYHPSSLSLSSSLTSSSHGAPSTLVRDAEQSMALVFGDLHLQDIRNWRESSFHPFRCVFPLFNTPYDDLLDQLWYLHAESSVQDSKPTSLASGGKIRNKVQAEAVKSHGRRGLVESVRICAWNGVTSTDSGDSYTNVCNTGRVGDGIVNVQVGSLFDQALVTRLFLTGVDRMGERGEFHTRVILKSK